MNNAIHVLHLEDDPDYSLFVKDLLVRDGLAVELDRVETCQELLASLDLAAFDIVLADYSLPACTGIEALQAVRQRFPDLPFVLVSGVIGEHAAIESLKLGTTDYVLKQWPEHLAPAVKRAVREARERAQRSQAQNELARRENYFRILTKHCLDVLCILDRNGAFQYTSPAVKRVLGYEPEDLSSRKASEVVHPDDMPGLLRAIERARSDPALTITHEFRVRRGDGVWRSLEVVGQNRLADPEIEGIVLNARDVTERKELESQLRQSQKLEAIGQLAGGVAHDFNNLLLVIHGHAEMLLAEEVQYSVRALECRNQIIVAAERAANLTRQLLVFSRKQVMQFQSVDLNQIIGNLAKMLARTIGEKIQLQCEYENGLPHVQADAGTLEQALINLVLNARDAMPHGGNLKIRTAKAIIDESYARSYPEARPGAFVTITVSDNGIGIAPGNLQHIFEPFFTTKAPGKGTGLGLSTAYGIVKQHNGWIEVTSQVNEGTTFTIFLSALPAKSSTDHMPVAEKPSPGGSEHILLVEDHPAVRITTRMMLERHGYAVWEASSGQEGLDVWETQGAHIDLLLTDMVMPDGITGRELAERLKKHKPNLKVIFTTGYSADLADADTEFVRQSRHYMLQKPFSSEVLACAIRQCLDEG